MIWLIMWLFQVGSELNWTQRMHLGSPPNKGEEGYSKCEMYKVIRIMMTVGMMMMTGGWVEMELDVSGSWLDVGHDACCGELCQWTVDFKGRGW